MSWCKFISHNPYPCVPSAVSFRSTKEKEKTKQKTRQLLAVLASVHDRRDLNGWKLFSPLSILSLCKHTHAVWLMLAFSGHMRANKCNYKRDVITIVLLLKLMPALLVWLTTYAEEWNCLPLSREGEKKKAAAKALPPLCNIWGNTTFKCRIWLSKNCTRKPFSRNSRERKLFKSG